MKTNCMYKIGIQYPMTKLLANRQINNARKSALANILRPLFSTKVYEKKPGYVVNARISAFSINCVPSQYIRYYSIKYLMLFTIT